MKKIYLSFGLLCLAAQLTAQNMDITPFYVGDRIPDLPLTHIINYKENNISMSKFGDKLIILDFWNIHCTSCIAMFPKEDSLQHLFPNDIQFVLITSDKEDKVINFLNKYDSIHNPLSLPVIIEDRVLSKMFRFMYIPHYVWIAPNGQILAETSDYLINKEAITQTLLPIRQEEARLKGNKYEDFNTHMQKPDSITLQMLKRF